mmetsp:Transcript_10577/g.26254  ORF Transcript_10577/g.26254 Transcript_10577/m.26254 type:complete len:97 (+) Transcript_10577:1-291(+)
MSRRRDYETTVSTQRATVPQTSFIRGTSPRRREDTFYFRPDPLTYYDTAEERDVFERCADRCLKMGDECWFISVVPVPHRSCMIHTTLGALTSFSV